uniref:Uncharacterized protein n=1 Tax=Oryza nivara TaxID=4536 RepID=A0A0E0GPI9_ORYNI
MGGPPFTCFTTQVKGNKLRIFDPIIFSEFWVGPTEPPPPPFPVGVCTAHSATAVHSATAAHGMRAAAANLRRRRRRAVFALLRRPTFPNSPRVHAVMAGQWSSEAGAVFFSSTPPAPYSPSPSPPKPPLITAPRRLYIAGELIPFLPHPSSSSSSLSPPHAGRRPISLVGALPTKPSRQYLRLNEANPFPNLPLPFPFRD